jgi:hypothetical protein
LKLNIRDSEQYPGKIIERIAMKDSMELLDNLVSNETESIEKMLRISKVDKRKILRLQNKLKALKKDIGEHKQSIKEYRNHLRNMSESTHTKYEVKSCQKASSGHGARDYTDQSVGK